MTKEVASSSSEERMLLRELNHRTNNEFAAAIGVISRVAARSSNADVKTALKGITELLHNYARVHRALQMPEHDTFIDAAVYVRKLCLAISRSLLDSRKIQLVLATEPLRLEPERCWRMGMIVYELIINAARHAFNRGDGEIRVELLSAGASVKCSVVDNGSADASVAPGRGLKIVRELTKSLGGHFEQKFGPRGSSSILVVPCAETTERSPASGLQPKITQVPEEIDDERLHANSLASLWLIGPRLLVTASQQWGMTAIVKRHDPNRTTVNTCSASAARQVAMVLGKAMLMKKSNRNVHCLLR